MTRSRYRFDSSAHPFFMTSTVVAWLPIFGDPDAAAIILDSWRFLQRERGIAILGYVIMENHLHWMAAGPELNVQVGRFKSFTARQILDLLERKNRLTLLQELEHFKLAHKTEQARQLWLEGSHPQELTTDEMVLQKLEYMHNNPLRRGYIADPTHWRYSSASNYAGLPSVFDVDIAWRL